MHLIINDKHNHHYFIIIEHLILFEIYSFIINFLNLEYFINSIFVIVNFLYLFKLVYYHYDSFMVSLMIPSVPKEYYII